MSKQEPTNSGNRLARLRARLSGAFWTVEDRVLGGGREAVEKGADIGRWPFERLWWVVEKRAIWPLRERIAGWDTSARTAAAGGLAAVAIGALALGAILASPSESGGGAPVAVAAVEP